jgi:hypothetical protein
LVHKWKLDGNFDWIQRLAEIHRPPNFEFFNGIDPNRSVERETSGRSCARERRLRDWERNDRRRHDARKHRRCAKLVVIAA